MTRSNSIEITVRIWFVMLMMTLMACSNQAQETGSKVKAPDVDIHTAVITGDLEAVKQHIAAGTNIDEKDPFGGSSPLITASLFGQTEIVKVLLDSGAYINFTNNDGSTALHTAAFFCREEIVKILVDRGADKTIKNQYGSTALLSVSGDFGEVKGIYELMQQQLGPMGLKVDLARLEKTRPVIANLLQ